MSDRREFLKGLTTAMAAALLPAKSEATAPKTSPATEIPAAAQKVEVGAYNHFSPRVINSQIEFDQNLMPQFQGGRMGPAAYSSGYQNISGSFTMYVEERGRLEMMHKLLDQGEPFELELHQGSFKYRFKAYVDRVTINASVQDLMTADVEFRAIQMEVVDA